MDRDGATPPPPEQAPPRARLNRRHLYRLLHVQPEAPVEVIRASHRALMQTLRAHPDLGGDATTAAELNAAWHVLKDARRRAAYDREAGFDRATARRPRRDAAAPVCVVCGAAADAAPPVADRCAACGAPARPLPATSRERPRELLGRRAGGARRPRGRIAVARFAVGGQAPPTAPQPVWWVDVSDAGAGVRTLAPAPVGAVVWLDDGQLEVAGRVRAARRITAGWHLHVQLEVWCRGRRAGA